MKSEPDPTIFHSPLLFLEPESSLNTSIESNWRLETPERSTLVSMAFLKQHANELTKATTVVVFNQAKPLLRALLKQKIDVSRPVCLTTLEKITGSQPSKDAPFNRLSDLLQSVEDLECKALARLECLVLRAFCSMEENGLYVDSGKWSLAVEKKRLAALEAAKQCEDLLADFTEKDLFGGAVLNLNHPAQMQALLEKGLGRKIEGIGNEHLEALDHPLAKAFLAYREANKIVSTYGSRFLEFVDPKTWRIHADFHSLGSSTGRVSCQKPNLQNLPSDPAFTDCLLAPPGRSLVHADFSACELRILAGLAQDSNFLTAINSDDDFHSVVASQLFDTKVSKSENPELRQRAKAINFGIIYGMGPKGLARSLNISEQEAHGILGKYFARFTRVKDFLEHCVDSAQKNGYARTLLGRRLYFENTAHGEHGAVDISRIAKNMPIQGTAAELAKLAMTRVHERLSGEFRDAFLVNMIHDELVVECAMSDRQAVAQAVKEEMLGAQEALFSNVRPDVEVSISD